MAQGTTKGVPIDVDPTLAANSDLLVPSQKAIKTYVDTANSTKQNTLVSNVNIKTVNSETLLGPGNVAIPAGMNWMGAFPG
jgi:GTP:adenosylcobinamide-phosphate guanylyltransferase